MLWVILWSVKLTFTSLFGVVSSLPTLDFHLKKQCFSTFPCLAKHRFANKVASVFHPPSGQQNDKKSFTRQQNAPKNQLWKSGRLFVEFLFQIGIKIGPKNHQKWTLAALLEFRGGRLRTTWTALVLLLRPKCRPWIPSGSNCLPPPRTKILSTYSGSSWILPISLTPFWSIFGCIYFRIWSGLDFVSILGSEMDPKCNKIASKSTRFLFQVLWVTFWSVKLTFTLLFGVVSSLSTLEFHWKKHSVFQRFLAWQSIASPKKSHQFFTSQLINKMITNHLQVNKALPKISCEKVIDF